MRKLPPALPQHELDLANPKETWAVPWPGGQDENEDEQHNCRAGPLHATWNQCFKSPAMPLSRWPSEQLSAAIVGDSCSYAI